MKNTGLEVASSDIAVEWGSAEIKTAEGKMLGPPGAPPSEPVAPAANRLRERQPGRDRARDGREVDPLPAADDPRAHRPADDATGQAQPPVPDVQRIDPVVVMPESACTR